MPVAASPSVLPRPATFVKMEDRKRPASGAVDDYPPSKRQAVNGGSKSKDDSGDMKEEAWIEVSFVTRHSPCVIIMPFPWPGKCRCRVDADAICTAAAVSAGIERDASRGVSPPLTVANAPPAGNSTPGSSQAS